MAFTKFVGFKAPSVAATFNAETNQLWSISGWLNGLSVNEAPAGTLNIEAGAFMQNGVVVVEDTSFTQTILGIGSPSDPLIFYAVSNGPSETAAPTYAFALRSALPTGVADIAENDGTVWKMVQGVSIAELLNKFEDLLANHIITVTAGEAISAGDNIRIDNTDGKAYVADTDTEENSSVVGVSLNTVTSGQLFDALTMGLHTDSGAPFTRGQIHYLDSGGGFTNTKPASPNIAVILGIAVTATNIIYAPERTSIGLDLFVKSIQQIINVDIKFKDEDEIIVGEGTVIFGGRQYVLTSDTTIQLLTSSGDMDDTDDPVDGGAGADEERSRTWYYIYAEPNGTTFNPKLSTAAPHKNLKPARQISKKSGGSLAITGSDLILEVDGVSSTKTLSGTKTAAELVDDINDSSGWSTVPKLRAYVVGSGASNFKIALIAQGNVGSLSTLEVTTSPDWGGSTLFTIGPVHSGQDWSWLKIAVKNDGSSNLMEFTFHRESGLYIYREARIHFMSTEPFATITEVFSGTAAADTEIDCADFVPVPIRRVIYALVAKGAGNHAIGENNANRSTGNYDVIINNTTDMFIEVGCTEFQRVRLHSAGNADLGIHGFYF